MNQDTPKEELQTPLLSQEEEEQQTQQVHMDQELLESPESSDEDAVPLRGQVQPPAYRDVWFAVLFYVQLLAVLCTAVTLGPLVLRKPDDLHTSDTTTLIRWNKVLFLFVKLFVIPLVLEVLAILGVYALLARNSRRWIQISFWSTPAVFLLVAVMSHGTKSLPLSGSLWSLAVLWTIISAFQYCASRRSIPYAASNLTVALTALKEGRPVQLAAVSMVAQLVLVVWWWIVLMACGGLVAYYHQKPACMEENDDDHHACSPPAWMYVLLAVSVLWTNSVVQNVLHTTTAGQVGSWWFPAPDDDEPSNHVMDSLHRALTYSFGSICMGSLFLTIVQILEQMTMASRRRENEGSQRPNYCRYCCYCCNCSLVLCFSECILHWLGRLLDYFNAWTFCYVGLYGYPFCTAGQNVQNLFRARGWSSIVTDRLVYRVLAHAKWVIAVLTGLLVVLVDALLDDASVIVVTKEQPEQVLRPIFWAVGTLAGLGLARVAFSVVESAARTILVCFAESPADAALNHPSEFACLRAGWMDSYPTEWPHVAEFMYSQTEDNDQAVV